MYNNKNYSITIYNYVAFKNTNIIGKNLIGKNLIGKNLIVYGYARPNIAYESNCPLNDGFLATPNIRAPKTTPIPTPAPISPVVAILIKKK